MKSYPSIPHVEITDIGRDCISFYKYDGSNLRFEWNRRKGFYKFGTRHRLFDHTDPVFGPAVQLFRDTLAENVERVMRDHERNPDTFIAFAEFLGPHSFAGDHDPKTLGVESNDPKRLVLLDVSVHRWGFMSPARFAELFGEREHAAQILYRGPLTDQYYMDVRSSKAVTGEGVIVKGGERHGLWMAKIKTEAYIDRLKARFGQHWKTYE